MSRKNETSRKRKTKWVVDSDIPGMLRPCVGINENEFIVIGRLGPGMAFTKHEAGGLVTAITNAIKALDYRAGKGKG